MTKKAKPEKSFSVAQDGFFGEYYRAKDNAFPEKCISQKELSEATGIDQSDLSKIEKGAANPSVGTLNRIAEALDAKLFVSIA